MDYKKDYNFDNPNDVSKFISKISDSLSNIKDDIVFNLELKKISKLTMPLSVVDEPHEEKTIKMSKSELVDDKNNFKFDVLIYLSR